MEALMPDGVVTAVTNFEPSSLVERYDRLLIPEPYAAGTIPDEHLPALRREIVATITAAPLDAVKQAIAVLIGSFKRADVVENPKIFVKAMQAELAGYPADVLDDAIVQARRTIKWVPAIAEMVEIC